MVLQHVAGLISLRDLISRFGSINVLRADVNRDREINSVDVALILQFSAGLVPSLPP
ncbi:MAG: hypothetical protein IIC91_15485 [Chloroflexi bacterium]|nr:hypothetical protein [Chloroflexota bacterium]